jgi:hypothetical protein
MFRYIRSGGLGGFPGVFVVRAPQLARQGAAAEVPPLRPRVVDAHVDVHDVLVVGVVLLEEERWAVLEKEVGGQRFCRDV